MSFNVAIDGPAGAGKSTIARAVAGKLKYIYVDTGAMYRAMALYMVRKGVDVSDEKQVSRLVEEAEITLGFEDDEQVVFLNQENVNPYIRTEEVGNTTSVISVYPKVREKMTLLQKKIASEKDVIMDGRDIGTVVLPNAQVKIYLTASSEVRAKRRYDELAEKGMDCDIKKIKADIEERDYRDMHREISPLVQAEDAVVVDTSHMSIEEVMKKIIGVIECSQKR